MRKILTFIIFPVIIVVAGYLVVTSVKKPVDFNKEKEKREAVAIQRLKDIRDLEVAFRSTYGKYTASIDSLIDFYNNGQIVIIRQIGSMDDSAAVANKLVRRDSIKINVKDTLFQREGFVLEDLRTIPFSNGKPIILKEAIKIVSGVSVPLFEAAMPYDDLLTGMDRQLIINFKAERRDMNKYEGLKVGSIDAPNNNAGNW